MGSEMCIRDSEPCDDAHSLSISNRTLGRISWYFMVISSNYHGKPTAYRRESHSSSMGVSSRSYERTIQSPRAMRSPAMFTGLPTGDPSASHGRPMDQHYHRMGHPWETHRTPMGDALEFHERPVGEPKQTHRRDIWETHRRDTRSV